MNNKIKNITGIALLSIFVFYTCSITLFPHKHIINGVVYIHSHPYQKDSKGNPNHSHSLAQIHTIQILSQLSITSFVLCVSFVKIAICFALLIVRKYNFSGYPLVIRNLRLRAPPAIRP